MRAVSRAVVYWRSKGSTCSYKPEQIIDRYGDEYRDTPITYTHQREQLGLAHAIL